MKKVYLVLSAFFVAGTVSAQLQKEERAPQKISKPERSDVVTLGSMDRAAGDPIYQDDFSNAALWDVTPDANGNDWEITTTTPTNVSDYMGDMASTTNANGFGTYDGISDLLGASVTPSSAYLTLIAPINCALAPFVTMNFEQRYRAFNSDLTYVEVSNDGSSWTQWLLNDEEPTNGPAQQELVSLNISGVAGSEATVYVRFYWEELGGDPSFGSGYGWMVDDLDIFESFNYDVGNISTTARAGVGVSYAAGLDYGNWCIDQVSAISFAGEVENLGAVIQTGTKLNVDITGAESFSGTSATVDLPTGGMDSLELTTTFTPGTEGTYDLTWFFDSDNTENPAATGNDSTYWTFYVNQYQYGRDDGAVSGGISAVSSSPDGVLTIGNTMDIFAADEFSSLLVGLTGAADNVDQIIYGECWKWDDGLGEWVFMDVTGDHTITAAENGGLVQLHFPSAISVAAGDLILITAGHYGGSVKPQFALAQGVDEQTVLGYVDGSAFFLSSPNAVIVRANMLDESSINEEANDFAIGQNMPNPFNANSAIQYTLNETANVSFKITDLSGKVIMNENFGSVAAGQHQVDLNGADFAEGAYMYTFTIGEKQVTKRMVVAK